jgi:hypothetical protein
MTAAVELEQTQEVDQQVLEPPNKMPLSIPPRESVSLLLKRHFVEG